MAANDVEIAKSDERAALEALRVATKRREEAQRRYFDAEYGLRAVARGDSSALATREAEILGRKEDYEMNKETQAARDKAQC